MQLVEVDVIDAKLVQALTQVLFSPFPGAVGCFGGDDDRFPGVPGNGLPDFGLTGGVGGGGIDEVYTKVEALAYDSNGLRFRAALYGDAAETKLGDLQTGATKGCRPNPEVFDGSP